MEMVKHFTRNMPSEAASILENILEKRSTFRVLQIAPKMPAARSR